MFEFRGEFAALSAALIWAVASVIYTQLGRQLTPLMLNLAKGMIAIGLLILTLLLRSSLFPTVPLPAVGLLLLSGAIGIGFGDTAYFAALNHLGTRRALVLESLAPPLAALLALVGLQEQLSTIAWIGILLTVSGVTWVVLERSPASAPSSSPSSLGPGIIWGTLAALGQAGGGVLSRAALAGSEIDPLWSTLVRLLGGQFVLLLWAIWQRRSWQEFQPLSNRRFLLTLIGTAFASTYLALWLQQIAFKYTATGVAQSLLAISPVFVLPIAIVMGEKVSLRAILGVLVAIAGVWLLFNR
ncbi:DMT family transporter [Pantanalinema sp. GBBB05]|uniref:DMT family transporter n=1 Tax=Pantanalinema sp. GBBB05 TaxID=2604139 RepID=UPI001E00C96D|nr:DMT family transporter [Pantanalinema sp. GBBB05]